jgi:hypothetical protein
MHNEKLCPDCMTFWERWVDGLVCWTLAAMLVAADLALAYWVSQ